MKTLVIFLSVIFFINFISALEVDFSCPSEVSVGGEFECDIEFSGDYDLKVDILCGDKRCARIWNGEFWGSTYYFVTDFKEDSVRLKIVDNFDGNCEGKLRLRENGKRGYSYEESFSIMVLGSSDENINEEKKTEEETLITTEIKKETLEKTNRVIDLNPAEENSEEIILYESKNEKIKNYAVYGFCLFLIFVIVVLVVRG